MRSRLGLAGNTLDVDGPTWERRDSGIGAGIDLYYEYLLKVRVMCEGILTSRFLEYVESQGSGCVPVDLPWGCHASPITFYK